MWTAFLTVVFYLANAYLSVYNILRFCKASHYTCSKYGYNEFVLDLKISHRRKEFEMQDKERTTRNERERQKATFGQNTCDFNEYACMRLLPEIWWMIQASMELNQRNRIFSSYLTNIRDTNGSLSGHLRICSTKRTKFDSWKERTVVRMFVDPAWTFGPNVTSTRHRETTIQFESHS